MGLAASPDTSYGAALASNERGLGSEVVDSGEHEGAADVPESVGHFMTLRVERPAVTASPPRADDSVRARRCVKTVRKPDVNTCEEVRS